MVTLDDSQAQALARAESLESLVIVGAPGSGKTTVAAQIALVKLAQAKPNQAPMVWSSSRSLASALRDQISAFAPGPLSTPAAQTATSAAFAILVARADSLGEPRPVLVTGAEQDSMLAELIEGYFLGGVAMPDWHGVIPDEAMRLEGFRDELRTLVMRALEADLDAGQLAQLGRTWKRPEWVAAATIYGDYLAGLAMRQTVPTQGRLFDSAEVIAEARAVLLEWDEASQGRVPSWPCVIVDEAQELTLAAFELLSTMREQGSQIVLLGNADQAVQGFRGSSPSVLDRVTKTAPHGWGAGFIELSGQHRFEGYGRSVAREIASRIGVVGSGSARASVANNDAADVSLATSSDSGVPDDLNDHLNLEPPTPASFGVSVVESPHDYGEARSIATYLRRAKHGLDGGMPLQWSDMAVIARSRSQLRQLRSALAAAEIPCAENVNSVPLHDQPAVLSLLHILDVANHDDGWTEDSAFLVLTSRLGGLDSIGVRRLRRQLLEKRRGKALPLEPVLADALNESDQLLELRSVEARRALAVSTTVNRVRKAMEIQEPPSLVLWAAWDGLGVAESLREGALAGSLRDHADVDAIMMLMRTAEQYTDRVPGSSVLAFVEYLRAQSFATDSLAQRGSLNNVVALETPASAAGKQWDAVIVAGLQEGVWPNPKVRDATLGGGYLADVLMGRASEDFRSAAGRQAAMRTVLDDETRAFLVAATRASSRLVFSYVESAESHPSRYIEWVKQAAEVGDGRVDRMAWNSASDIRAVVAGLRVEAMGADADLAQLALRRLAALAVLKAPGASPDEWFGVPELSTDEAFWDDDQQIPLRPSAVESAEKCTLRWALETAGGGGPESAKQRLGTLVHRLAQEYVEAQSRGENYDLQQALVAYRPMFGPVGQLSSEREFSSAVEIVHRLETYLKKSDADGVQAFAECSVVHTEDRFVLRGRLDRIEIYPDGSVYVVDLKTGGSISIAEAQSNAQMALYQYVIGAHPEVLGAEQERVEVAGARLVYLKEGARGPAIREQAPINGEETRNRLLEIVDAMASSTFAATVGRQCDSCSVRRACPVQPDGRQVSATCL